LYIDAAVQSAEIMSQAHQRADYSHDAMIAFSARSPNVRLCIQSLMDGGWAVSEPLDCTSKGHGR